MGVVAAVKLLRRPTTTSPPCGMFPGTVVLHLTPSGTSKGADQAHPTSSGSFTAGFPPMWWPTFLLVFSPPLVGPGSHLTPSQAPPTPISTPEGTTEEQDTGRDTQEHEDDRVALHDEELNTLFAKFN